MRHGPVFARLFGMLDGGRGSRTALVSVFAGGLILIGVLLAHGTDLRSGRCVEGVVMVIAQSQADRDAACDGAERAILVLDGLGLPVLSPIVVHVVDEIDDIQGASALGTFDARTRLVKVLARSAYSLGSIDETVLGLPFDDELHASVFAHEVTHAVFHQHEARIPLSYTAHEYVAYSVQVMTLPEDYRRRLLDRFDVSPFTNVHQVNGVMLAFDPNSFGVKAYLHFRDSADQNAVLRGLVRASRAGVTEWY